MFVKVPVRYQARFLRAGAKEVKPFDCGEMVEVHVAEVDGDAAPVAATWRAGVHVDAAGVPAVTRWFDGSHWWPVREAAEDGVRAVLPAADFEEGRHLPDGAPLIDGYERTLVESGTLKPQSAYRVRHLERSGRQAAIDAKLRDAENVLIVDGTVWKRGAEPVYVVEGTPGRPLGSVVSAAYVGSSRLVVDAFAADRWDDFVDHMNSMGGQPDPLLRIELSVPGAVSFVDEEKAIERAVKGVLDALAPGLASLPSDVIEGWTVLRDALRSAGAEGGHEALVEAASGANPAVARVAHDFPDAHAALGRTLARWSARPIDAEAISPGA